MTKWVYIFNEYIFGFWTKPKFLSFVVQTDQWEFHLSARWYSALGILRPDMTRSRVNHECSFGTPRANPPRLVELWKYSDIKVAPQLRRGLNKIQSKEKRQQSCLPTVNCQSECPVHLSSYIGDLAGVGSIICHLRTKNKLMALRIWLRSKICQHSKFNSIQLAFKAFQAALSGTPFFFFNQYGAHLCVRMCVCGDPGDL